jgi:hypothetical protein
MMGAQRGERSTSKWRQLIDQNNESGILLLGRKLNAYTYLLASNEAYQRYTISSSVKWGI